MDKQIKRRPGRPASREPGSMQRVTLELPVELWQYITKTASNRTKWIIDALQEKRAQEEQK